MNKELISYTNPKSHISEIFKTLRTNIQFMNTNKKVRTILITSTNEGEGKSTVTANLAVAFAQSGKRVVLIDSDMRKGRQNRIFGMKRGLGLSDCLAESCQTEKIDYSKYIKRTEIENLLIITSGTTPPNPSELLMTPGLIKLIKELEKIVDVILIDGTPVSIVTDSIIISRIVDGVIIVAQSKKVKKEDLLKTIKKLKHVGSNILGIVLNRVTINIKKYEKSYYYASKNMDRAGKTKYTSIPIYDKREEKNEKEETINIDKKNVEPKQAQRNINRDLENTDEMIKQINEYIENQKNKLRKG